MFRCPGLWSIACSGSAVGKLFAVFLWTARLGGGGDAELAPPQGRCRTEAQTSLFVEISGGNSLLGCPDSTCKGPVPRDRPLKTLYRSAVVLGVADL